MATTNDESWQAWINRMYRDEERKWERDRFLEVPGEKVEDQKDTGGEDAKGK